ncbi:MAG: hypothetical protein ABIU05_01525 [Nitrospirales bacterium]
MKQVILCTVISFFVVSGFLAKPWGPDLAGAATCSDLPGVEVCILIKPGGIVDIVTGKDENGKDIKFRKPKKSGGGKPDPQKPGTNKPRKDLPPEIDEDITTANFIENSFTIYGDKTCGLFNGVWYCW